MFTVPIISKSVKKSAKKNALQVCLLSPHPLVLSEFERVLANPAFKTISRHLESTLGPDLRHLPIPKAAVYVVDAHVAQARGRRAAFQYSRSITPRRASSWSPKNLTPRKAIRCCRWAPRDCSAMPKRGSNCRARFRWWPNGGFWVPRSVLSGFVDSVLAGSHSRRLKVDTAADLSRREQEVLNSLLENLANKEIGSKLNISERTVKFHVSNLLNKFGVRRRADLILLCYQKRSATP